MITDHVKEKLESDWVPMNQCSHCGECDDPESTRRWPEDEDGDRICWGCKENEGEATGRVYVFGVYKRNGMLLRPKVATRYMCFRGETFDQVIEAALVAAKRQDEEAFMGAMRLAIYPHGILADEVWLWTSMVQEGNA